MERSSFVLIKLMVRDCPELKTCYGKHLFKQLTYTVLKFRGPIFVHFKIKIKVEFILCFLFIIWQRGKNRGFLLF